MSLFQKSTLLFFQGCAIITKSKTVINALPDKAVVAVEQSIENQQPSTSEAANEDKCEKAMETNPALAAPKQKSNN